MSHDDIPINIHHTSTDFEFSVLSWNVLAHAYAGAKQYPNCTQDTLSWEYRAPRLRKVIAESRADVICLQEADRPDFWTRVLMDAGYDVVYARRGTPWVKYFSANPKTQKVFAKFEKSQYDLEHLEESDEGLDEMGAQEAPASEDSLSESVASKAEMKDSSRNNSNSVSTRASNHPAFAPKSESLGETDPELVREQLARAAQTRNVGETSNSVPEQSSKTMPNANKDDGCILAWKGSVFELQYPAYSVNFDDLAHDGASFSRQLHRKHHHLQELRQQRVYARARDTQDDLSNADGLALDPEASPNVSDESLALIGEKILYSSNAAVAGTQARFYRHNIGVFAMLFPRAVNLKGARVANLSTVLPDLRSISEPNSQSVAHGTPTTSPMAVSDDSATEESAYEHRLARLFARPVIVATAHLYFNPNSEDVKFWQILYLTRVLEYYRLTSAVHLRARTRLIKSAILEYLNAVRYQATASDNGAQWTELADSMEKLLSPMNQRSKSTSSRGEKSMPLDCCGNLAGMCAVCAGAKPLDLVSEAIESSDGTLDIIKKRVQIASTALAQFRARLVEKEQESHPYTTLPRTTGEQSELYQVEQSIPVMLCGDFNSTPDSAVYRFLATGKIPFEQVLSGSDQSRSIRMAAAAQATAAVVSNISKRQLSTNATESTEQAVPQHATDEPKPSAYLDTSVKLASVSTDEDLSDSICKISPFITGSSALLPASEAIAKAIETIKDRTAPKGCNVPVMLRFIPNFSTAPEKTETAGDVAVVDSASKPNAVPRVVVSQGLARLTKSLRSLGFDAVEVEKSSSPQEIATLLRIAREERRTLITDSRNLVKRRDLPPFILLPAQACGDLSQFSRISTDGHAAAAAYEAAAANAALGNAAGKDPVLRGKKGQILSGEVQGTQPQQRQRQNLTKALNSWAWAKLGPKFNRPPKDGKLESPVSNTVDEYAAFRGRIVQERLGELVDQVVGAHGYDEVDIDMLKKELWFVVKQELRSSQGPPVDSEVLDEKVKWSWLPEYTETCAGTPLSQSDTSSPSSGSSIGSVEQKSSTSRSKPEGFRSSWAKDIENVAENHAKQMEEMNNMELQIAKTSAGDPTPSTHKSTDGLAEPNDGDDSAENTKTCRKAGGRGHLANLKKPSGLSGYILAEQLKPSATRNIDFRIKVVLDAFKDQYSPQSLMLRCTRCNGLYRNVSIEEVRMDPSIPDAVKEGVNHVNGRPLHFYQCVHCLRIYWWGRKSMVVAERMRRHLLKFNAGPDAQDNAATSTIGEEEDDDDDGEDDDEETLGSSKAGHSNSNSNRSKPKGQGSQEAKTDTTSNVADTPDLAQAAADSVAGSVLAPSILRSARILEPGSKELHEAKAIIAARNALQRGEPMREDYVDYQKQLLAEDSAAEKRAARLRTTTNPRPRKEIRSNVALTSITGREVIHLLPDGRAAIISGESSDALLVKSLQSIAQADADKAKAMSLDDSAEAAESESETEVEVDSISSVNIVSRLRKELETHIAFYESLKFDTVFSLKPVWLEALADASIVLSPRPLSLLRFLKTIEYAPAMAFISDGAWRRPSATPAIAALEELFNAQLGVSKSEKTTGAPVRCIVGSSDETRISSSNPNSEVAVASEFTYLDHSDAGLPAVLLAARAATAAVEAVWKRIAELVTPSEELEKVLERSAVRRLLIDCREHAVRRSLLSHAKGAKRIEEAQIPEAGKGDIVLDTKFLQIRYPLPELPEQSVRLVYDARGEFIRTPPLLMHAERFGLPVVSPSVLLPTLILAPPRTDRPLTSGTSIPLVSFNDAIAPDAVLQRLTTRLLKLVTALETTVHLRDFAQHRETAVKLAAEHRRYLVAQVLDVVAHRCAATSSTTTLPFSTSLLGFASWPRLFALQAPPRVLNTSALPISNPLDALVLETSLPLVSAYADYQRYELICLAPSPALVRAYSGSHAATNISDDTLPEDQPSPTRAPTLMRLPTESFVTDVVTDSDDTRSFEECVSRLHVVEHVQPGFPGAGSTLAEVAAKDFGTRQDLNRAMTVGSLEPQFTNRTAKFSGCLDYIFYTSNTPARAKSESRSAKDSTITGGNLYLVPHRRWRIFTADEIAQTGGLPCLNFPSDHVPLAVVFRMHSVFEW